MEPTPSRDTQVQTLLSNQELLAQISTNLLNAERTFGLFSPQYASVLSTFFEFLAGMERGGSGGKIDLGDDEVLSRAMGGLGLGGNRGGAS
ncbi:hypothetical protein FQN54_006727 [Arachnomyces sp. PD_36]|nr:hypothetical protein FQN54_006727 [Arachnomyces sp. PD_36]